jgi:hypothetical protein
VRWTKTSSKDGLISRAVAPGKPAFAKSAISSSSEVERLTKALKRAAWPEDLVDRKGEEDFVAQLPEHALAFYPTWTLPSVEYLAAFAELGDADRDAHSKLEIALHAKDPKKSAVTRLLGWPITVQGEIIDGTGPVVLLQLDASMAASGAVQKMFSQWGGGLVHFLVDAAALAKRDVSNASAQLAYT